jgi:serine/threonine-protein kinase RsbW
VVLMRLVLRLPRDPVTVPVTRRAVDCALDALGVTDECRGDVGLALSEACANVVQHADDAVDYTVTVTATSSACTIDVEDAGRGISGDPAFADPRGRRRARAMSESGRGLNIVRTVMDAVHIVAGPGGVAIHMVKQLIFGKRGYLRRLHNES